MSTKPSRSRSVKRANTLASRVRTASGAASTEPEYVVAHAFVDRVERISPTFARITFTGPELANFGNPARVLDQRIKLIFPPDGGPLAEVADSVDWYRAWRDIPNAERGTMRTYSIRKLEDGPQGTTLAIDFVLHIKPGTSGPGAKWADNAQPGDELLLIGPRRGAHSDGGAGGGIEFAPGGANSILLAGDETAAPAIARILEELGDHTRATAFIEVPTAEDLLDTAQGPGIVVNWLVRDDKPHGTKLVPAVLAAAQAQAQRRERDSQPTKAEGQPDQGGSGLLWETPAFSSSGEDLVPAGKPIDRYFWIAGENHVVTALRRGLVKGLGVDRSHVAFTGYWRKGVATQG